MTEDSILGYDLYSSALAEILSEPSLNTPITVGLYAKWGSGKSFLLLQLKNEMKSFAKLTHIINLKINFVMILILIAFILTFTLPFLLWNWIYGAILFVSVSIITFLVIGKKILNIFNVIYDYVKYCFKIAGSKFLSDKRGKEWAERMIERLATQIVYIKLLGRILFINPFNQMNHRASGGSGSNTPTNHPYHYLTKGHKNLKFIFVEYGKISAIGGETALALMIASLYSKLELHYGMLTIRLCRAFHKTDSSHYHSKFKRFCCVPSFFLVIIVIVFLFALTAFVRFKGFDFKSFNSQEQAFVFSVLFLITVSILSSSFTW